MAETIEKDVASSAEIVAKDVASSAEIAAKDVASLTAAKDAVSAPQLALWQLSTLREE